MRVYQAQIRKLHRSLAPIMLLPLLLTLFTGAIYQLVDSAGKGDDFEWMLRWHKGHFGNLHLEVIYPYLNALGLLILSITGISMWFQMRRNSKRSRES